MAIADKDREARREAALDGLAEAYQETGIAALIHGLEDVDEVVRWCAASFIGYLAGSEDERDPPSKDPSDYTEEYYRRQPDVVEWRIWQRLQGRYSAIHEARWDSPVWQSLAAVPALRHTLRDAVPGIRERSAEALGLLQNSAALEDLVNAVRDSDFRVRRAAVVALGKFRDSNTVPVLIEATTDADVWIRCTAIYTLRDFEDAAVLPAFIARLRDEAAEARVSAADAIREKGDASAVHALVAALDDPYWLVRLITAEALGKIGDASAIPALISQLEKVLTNALRNPYSADGMEGTALIQALGAMKATSAIPLLTRITNTGNKMLRSAALGALRNLSASSEVVSLRAALHDLDPHVRASAARGLGDVGDHASIPQLIEALRPSHPFLRAAAAYALGKLKAQVAVRVLVEYLRDVPFVSRAVVEALGEIGDTSVVPILQGFQRENARFPDASAQQELDHPASNSISTVIEAALSKLSGSFLSYESLDGGVPDDARKKILERFGGTQDERAPYGVDYRRPGYHRRFLLNAISLQVMLPVWQYFDPNESTLFVYYNLAIALYTGKFPHEVGAKILRERDQETYILDKESVLRHASPYGIDLEARHLHLVTPPKIPYRTEINVDLEAYGYHLLIVAASLLVEQAVYDMSPASYNADTSKPDIAFAIAHAFDALKPPPGYFLAPSIPPLYGWSDDIEQVYDNDELLEEPDDTDPLPLPEEPPYFDTTYEADLLEANPFHSDEIPVQETEPFPTVAYPLAPRSLTSKIASERRRRTFWHWWLRVAVPYAYQTVHDPDLTGYH